MKPYTESDLEPMYKDSLIRIILRLQTDMEANEREYDALREEIRYARAVAQSWDDCQGWDPNWCPECMKRWGDVEYDGPDTLEEARGER